MELLAGDRLGKYEIAGRLATGGMAEVYLALSLGHGGFSKPVALKRMLPNLACEPGFREMFMQEAAVAARLSHPNIVQIFDFAEERGELYIAMELVHGVNLKQLQADSLARGPGRGPARISPLLAAEICRGVARGLAHAWQVPDEQGRPSHLIHRDVSPHNILLSYEGDSKLADFGIAKPAGKQTSVGVLKGKLLYMAPEQVISGPLDARSDVFALGIVLWEAAMGWRTPFFDAKNEAAVKEAVRSRRIPPPVRMDPDFPKSLSSAIMKALEREPEHRFQSAADFADALGEAIHHEAKGPQEYALAAFMRRFYGEPPPLRALMALASARSRRAVVEDPLAPSELERLGDDPFANTVTREQAEGMRAALAEGRGGRTRNERQPAAAKAGAAAAAVLAAGARGSAAGSALPRRWFRPLVVATGLVGAASLGAVGYWAAGRLPPLRTGEMTVAVSGDAPAAPASAAKEANGSPAAANSAGRDEPAGVASAADGGLPRAVVAAAAKPVSGRGSGGAVDVAGRIRPEQVEAKAASSQQERPSSPRGEAPGVAGSGSKSAPSREVPPAAGAGSKRPVAPAAPSETGSGSMPRATTAASRAASRAAGSKPPAPRLSAKKPAARIQGSGVISIHVKPWAFAWLDAEPFTGKIDQEAAPLLRRAVSAGKHIVHVKDPLGRSRSIPVTVPADHEVRIENPFGVEE